MPTASSMTFTEITRAADQIRGRWHFNWLELDPPSWSWPARPIRGAYGPGGDQKPELIK